MNTPYKVFHGIGGSVCHQLPGRSVSVGGMQLPFCARCTGLYLGFFFFILFLDVLKKKKGDGTAHWGCHLVWIICLLPLMIDGIFTTIGIWNTPAWGRFLTGLLFAGGVSVHLILGLRYKPEKDFFVPVANLKQYVFTTLAAALLYYCAKKIDHKILWLFLSFFSCAGLFFTVSYAIKVIGRLIHKNIRAPFVWIFTLCFIFLFSFLHGGFIRG